MLLKKSLIRLAQLWTINQSINQSWTHGHQSLFSTIHNKIPQQASGSIPSIHRASLLVLLLLHEFAQQEILRI
jgi:hypothetical protein